MIDEQIKYSETNIIHGALGLEEWDDYLPQNIKNKRIWQNYSK